MNEVRIERFLKRKIENIGGLCIKLVSPSMAGVPDRLILLPKGKIYFAELKALGGKLRPLQAKRKDKLESLGFKVYVIDTFEKVDELLKDVID